MSFRRRKASIGRHHLPPAKDANVAHGAFIWHDDALGDVIEPDPLVEEHLAIVMNHPAFTQELERLADIAPERRNLGELAEVADAWAISLWDLQVLLEDIDQDTAGRPLREGAHEFAPGASDVFVEVRPSAYVLWIPKLVNSRHRRAISGWLDEVQGEPWLTPRERQLAIRRRTKPRPMRTSKATLDDRLVWFIRWNNGETFRQIWDSIDYERALTERDVRNAVYEVRRRMAELSPSCLRALDTER